MSDLMLPDGFDFNLPELPALTTASGEVITMPSAGLASAIPQPKVNKGVIKRLTAGQARETRMNGAADQLFLTANYGTKDKPDRRTYGPFGNEVVVYPLYVGISQSLGYYDNAKQAYVQECGSSDGITPDLRFRGKPLTLKGAPMPWIAHTCTEVYTNRAGEIKTKGVCPMNNWNKAKEMAWSHPPCNAVYTIYAAMLAPDDVLDVDGKPVIDPDTNQPVQDMYWTLIQVNCKVTSASLGRDVAAHVANQINTYRGLETRIKTLRASGGERENAFANEIEAMLPTKTPYAYPLVLRIKQLAVGNTLEGGIQMGGQPFTGDPEFNAVRNDFFSQIAADVKRRLDNADYDPSTQQTPNFDHLRVDRLVNAVNNPSQTLPSVADVMDALVVDEPKTPPTPPVQPSTMTNQIPANTQNPPKATPGKKAAKF